MKIGSLFSGIGGLELGVEWVTGAETVWNCEKDKFCRAILKKHWPDAKQYTDVHDIDETAEGVDIITGGFPCQDLSIAGKKAGLQGQRSGLWHEYARIVGLLRPQFVFVENVPAIRNFVSDGGLGRVLGDLAESGYDAEWDCVPAASAGAPHVRDRFFLLAWRSDVADSPGGGSSGEQEGADHETVHGTRPRADDRAGVRHPAKGVRVDGGDGAQRERCAVLAYGEKHPFPPPPRSDRWPEYHRRFPEAQPAFRRDVDGFPDGMERSRSQRLKVLGNAVVPQASAFAWRLLSERAGVSL